VPDDEAAICRSRWLVAAGTRGAVAGLARRSWSATSACTVERLADVDGV